ncbi:hypothetical protein SLS60_004177 [Paraconiothyrium brasiliense]|uniref:Uncharacterized protein n=1 Tax=Paraconiothyrium brasiliense TaxID=300254 RepID=A0ABR3RQQ8_9PLEO
MGRVEASAHEWLFAWYELLKSENKGKGETACSQLPVPSVPPFTYPALGTQPRQTQLQQDPSAKENPKFQSGKKVVLEDY